MTRLTYKEKSLSAALIMLIIVLIAISLSSCGSAWHLKRRDYHERKAIEKGAKVTADTVYKEVQVFIPQVQTDTIFKATEGDTVVLERDRLKITYINLPGDTVILDGECRADTVEVKVPVTVTKKIKAGMTTWETVILCLWVIPGGWLLMTFVIIPLFRRR